MWNRIFFFVCAYTLICVTNGVSLSFFNKCKAEDSKCLKESTQTAIPIFANGIPEIGIDVMDPVHFKTLDASSANLKLYANELDVIGLRNCQAKKVQRDLSKSTLSLKLQCAVKLEGMYEMHGRILIIPIEGKGKVHADIPKIIINIEGELKEKEKGGEKYWAIKKWGHNFELKEKSYLEFENLFNGNEVLGAAAREIMKTSANDVIYEIGPPVVHAVVAKLIDNIRNLFKNVPIKDLSLDV